jgi:Ca2+-binding EF-hand superfamily protein
MKLRKLWIPAIVSLAIAPVYAAEFSELDADQDGYISNEEASADPALVEQFSTLDANADGQIDEEEFAGTGGGEEAPAEEPTE